MLDSQVQNAIAHIDRVQVQLGADCLCVFAALLFIFDAKVKLNLHQGAESLPL